MFRTIDVVGFHAPINKK